MAFSANLCRPLSSLCNTQPIHGMRVIPAASGVQVVHRKCSVAAGYKARISSLDEEETKEYKIRKLAEILGTDVEQASSLVKLRPGLLVVPNGDMSFYEHRVSRLAFKHGLSPRQVSVMVLENPQLLFSPRV